MGAVRTAEDTHVRVQATVRRPYAGYAAILAAFGGTVAATAALERVLGRDRRPPSTLDYVLLCAATFKSARALSRERVGSVVRQPFVESDDGNEVSETPDERPVGGGMRRAVGELVTCTRCVGTWAAVGLLASQAGTPRLGRLLTWSLAAGAANDFLQAGFAAVCARELPPAHADDPVNHHVNLARRRGLVVRRPDGLRLGCPRWRR